MLIQFKHISMIAQFARVALVKFDHKCFKIIFLQQPESLPQKNVHFVSHESTQS